MSLRSEGEYKHTLVNDVISYAIADLLGFHRSEDADYTGSTRRGRHAGATRVITDAPCNLALQAVTALSLVVTFVTLFLIAYAFDIQPIFESFPTQVTMVTRLGQLAGALYTIIVLRDEIFGSSFDLGILVLFLFEKNAGPAARSTAVAQRSPSFSRISRPNHNSGRDDLTPIPKRRSWGNRSFYSILRMRSSVSDEADTVETQHSRTISRRLRFRRLLAVLLCLLRFIMGMLALWVSTLLICESDSIIELFRDFAAFTFVVELDRLVLLSVNAGMLGWDLADYVDGLSLHTSFYLEPDAGGLSAPGTRTSGWIVRMGSLQKLDDAEARDAAYMTGSTTSLDSETVPPPSPAYPQGTARTAEQKKKSIARCVRCTSVVLVALSLVPVLFFVLVWTLQQSYHLACPDVYVTVGLGGVQAAKFQGSYVLDGWDITGYPHYISTTGFFKNHLFYDQENIGAWCLADEDSYGGDELTCQAWSRDTDTYNVVDAGVELSWTTVTPSGALNAEISIECEVCSGRTSNERRNACSYRGICELGTGPFAGYFAWEKNHCVCEPGAYGKICQYIEPCDHFSATSAASDYGGVVGRDFYALYLDSGDRLLMHERQVYLSTDFAEMGQVGVAYYHPCDQAWMLGTMAVSLFAGTSLEGGVYGPVNMAACWQIQRAFANCWRRSEFRSLPTSFLDPTLAPMAASWEQFVAAQGTYKPVPAMSITCQECLSSSEEVQSSCINGGSCVETSCTCPRNFFGLVDSPTGKQLCIAGACADNSWCDCPGGYTGSLCNVPPAVMRYQVVVKYGGVCYETISQSMDATSACSPIFRRPLAVALNAADVAVEVPKHQRRRLSIGDVYGHTAEVVSVEGVDTHVYNVVSKATDTVYKVLKEGSGDEYPLRREQLEDVQLAPERCEAANDTTTLLKIDRSTEAKGELLFLMRNGTITLDEELPSTYCAVLRPLSPMDFPEDLSLAWHGKALELAFLRLSYAVNVPGS